LCASAVAETSKYAATPRSHSTSAVLRLGSVVWSPRFGAIALAILHHSAWMVGTRVSIDGGDEGTVSELPFA
jgi:hypothetical protein